MTKWWIAAISGLFSFYYTIPQLEITDSRYVLATADVLIQTGSLDLWPLVRADKNLPLASNGQVMVRAIDLPFGIATLAKEAGAEPFGNAGVDEYFATIDLFKTLPVSADIADLITAPVALPLFPTWPSFAAIPVSLVALTFGMPVFDGTTFDEDRNEYYQRILAAVFAAITVGFFYAAARCLLQWPLALGLAVWLSFGPLVSSTSRALWPDSFALPLSFSGLYILVRVTIASRPMPYWPIVLAAAVSFAFMMKAQYAVPGTMFGILVLLSGKVSLRGKTTFVAACALFAALFLGTSTLIYGQVLPPYFAPSRVGALTLANFEGVLFSPGRGVLWFTPSLLVACCVPLLVWRDRTQFILGIAAVAAVGSSVLVVSSYYAWWGGASYGPRLLQFALPSVALLALIFVKTASLRSGRQRIVAFGLCCAVLGWEGFVHVSGVTSPRGWMWNATPIQGIITSDRSWDWSDPQFLAAFRPTRPTQKIDALPEDGWVRMASVCSDHFVGEGFSGRESEFRWTDGGHAFIFFTKAPVNAGLFAIEVMPFVDARNPVQHLSVTINNTKVGNVVLTERRWTRMQFDVSTVILKSVNTIELSLPDAHPARGGSPDKRRLGVAIRGFVMTAQSNAENLPIAEICR